MNLLSHLFVSPKGDGADPTQVQPSNWNAEHRFTGGNLGDVLISNSTTQAGAVFAPPFGYFGAYAAGASIGLGPGFGTYTIRMSPAADQDLQGVYPTAGNFAAGTRLRLVNTGIGTVKLVQSGSVSPGKFSNVATSTYTYLRGANGGGPGGSAEYVYDGANWLMLSHEQGGPVALGLTNANLSGISATSIASTLYLRGRDAHVHVHLVTATVPTAAAPLTIAGLPLQFAETHGPARSFVYNSGVSGGWVTGLLILGGSTSLLIFPSVGTFGADSAYTITIDSIIPIL